MRQSIRYAHAGLQPADDRQVGGGLTIYLGEYDKPSKLARVIEHGAGGPRPIRRSRLPRRTSWYNLNTHRMASLYKAMQAAETRRIAKRPCRGGRDPLASGVG